MTRRRQESIPDWLQEARDLARAERELEIEHWVRINIGFRDNGQWSQLYRFDFPRESEERYRWIIRWRTAALQCQYPRKYIISYYCAYDKRTGLKTDFSSCLGKLTAAKAQITKARRNREAYIAAQKKKYPLFYDPSSDPDLEKFDKKLAIKKENCSKLHETIDQAMEAHRLSEPAIS